MIRTAVTVERKISEYDPFSNGVWMTLIGEAGAVILLICQFMFDFVADKEQTTVESRVRAAGVVAKF